MVRLGRLPGSPSTTPYATPSPLANLAIRTPLL
jgi:hypothetical protein